MSGYQPHGVSNEQVVKSRHYLRDTRRPSQRFWDFTRDPANLGIMCFVMAGFVFIYPAFIDMALIAAFLIILRARTIKPSLPFKLPHHAKVTDKNDPLPGDNGKFHKARGGFYLGNTRKKTKELWFSISDVVTHFLFIGGTGSGKTEAMSSLVSNAMIWGSGFSYTDGKGDSALWVKIFAMLRSCGREDDLYVINYMTASRTIDPDAPIEDRLSNQFNPYLTGSADSIIQLTSSLLSEASGDSATWREKALGLLTVMAYIVYAMRERERDEHGQPFVLDVASMRPYLTLDTLIDVHLRAKHKIDGFEISQTAFKELEKYLESVPGFQYPEDLWKRDKKTKSRPFDEAVIVNKEYHKQPEQQTYVQHGYLQNQFTRVLSQLSGVYGHIYRCHYGEVDMQDLVVNRRVLVAMLPALEKSPDELRSLGKIIVSAKKTMLATGLGARLEGSQRQVIDSKPVHSVTPFIDVNDEYGYYSVVGFAVVPAQARSLGVSMVFAGQDTPSFGKESKEEAQAIFGNTLIKCAMRIEDSKESFELFQNTAGEALVTQTSGFNKNPNSWLSNVYHDNSAAGVERRNRIDLRDIRAQKEGQAHIFYGAEIQRGNLFYGDIPSCREYRLNRFVQVLPLTDDVIAYTQPSITPDLVNTAIQNILNDTTHKMFDLMRGQHTATMIQLRRERSNLVFADGLINHLTTQLDEYDKKGAESIQAIINQSIEERPQRDSAKHSEAGAVAMQPVEAQPDAVQPVEAQPDDDEAQVCFVGLGVDFESEPTEQPRTSTQDGVAPDNNDKGGDNEGIVDINAALSAEDSTRVSVSLLSKVGSCDSFMQGVLVASTLHNKLTPQAAALAVSDANQKRNVATDVSEPQLDSIQQCEAHYSGDSVGAEQAAKKGHGLIHNIPSPSPEMPAKIEKAPLNKNVGVFESLTSTPPPRS